MSMNNWRFPYPMQQEADSVGADISIFQLFASAPCLLSIIPLSGEGWWHTSGWLVGGVLEVNRGHILAFLLSYYVSIISMWFLPLMSLQAFIKRHAFHFQLGTERKYLHNQLGNSKRCTMMSYDLFIHDFSVFCSLIVNNCQFNSLKEVFHNQLNVYNIWSIKTFKTFHKMKCDIKTNIETNKCWKINQLN